MGSSGELSQAFPHLLAIVIPLLDDSYESDEVETARSFSIQKGESLFEPIVIRYGNICQLLENENQATLVQAFVDAAVAKNSCL
jgi:hypothetical protein